MALDPSNSSSLDQLALKGLTHRRRRQSLASSVDIQSVQMLADEEVAREVRDVLTYRS